MVDMGQADRSLRASAHRPLPAKCWVSALYEAAKLMGHTHFMDVPDSDVQELKAKAKRVQLDAALAKAPSPVLS